MFDNQVHFIDHWHVEAAVEEVYDIMLFSIMSEWWPSVFVKYEVLDPGDEKGVGRRIKSFSKARLPYSLQWISTITQADAPRHYRQEVNGDFVGTGDWYFEQNGSWVDVTLDWKVRAEKPILKTASRICHPLLVPIYRWNHQWGMKRGEESIWLELARRRAKTPEERALVPAPPGSGVITASPTSLVFGGILLASLSRMRRGRKKNSRR
jgi:hypothetical protein